MAKKIMIVDDALETLALIEAVFQGQGFETVSCPSATDAIVKLRRDRPDLIVLDVLMPEIDGFAFFKVLKKERLTSTIPVLVLTVRARMEDTFRSLGAEEFLAKPFDSQKLLNCVSQILGLGTSQAATAENTSEAQLSGSDVNTQASATATLPKPVPSAKINISSKRVLIVATDDAVISAIKNALMPFNVPVEVAKLELLVMSKISSFKPDMIVLDVLFGDRPATELVFKIKQLPRVANNPIILFSHIDKNKMKESSSSVGQKAMIIDLARTACLKAGASDAIGGFEIDRFMQTMKKYL